MIPPTVRNCQVDGSAEPGKVRVVDVVASELLIIPGTPAVVGELAPAFAPARGIVAAARQAAGRHVRAAIVGSHDERWRTDHTGTFAAWGAAHVDVGGGNYLPELVARYVLGPESLIAESRSAIGALDPEVLTVVVLDGPAGLTPRAPLAMIPEAPAVHTQLQEFLAGRRALGLSSDELRTAGVDEPALWLELAEFIPARAELIVTEDSLGVGGYVAKWEV